MNTENCIASFIKSREAEGLSRKTITWYHRYLDNFAQMYTELPDRPEMVERFLEGYPGQENRHGAYRTLRAFYNFLEKRYDCDNIVRQITAPKMKAKEKPSLTVQELKSLLDFAGHSEQVKTMLILLADTGIRIGEAVSLTSNDVHEQFIVVRGKTGQRIVPISPITYSLLGNIATTGKLFPWSVGYYSHCVAKAFKTVTLNGSAHTLRHTFATLWEGTDLTLKTILGHSSLQMVENYRHQKDARVIAEHAKYSPLNRVYPKCETTKPNIEGIDELHCVVPEFAYIERIASFFFARSMFLYLKVLDQQIEQEIENLTAVIEATGIISSSDTAELTPDEKTLMVYRTIRPQLAELKETYRETALANFPGDIDEDLITEDRPNMLIKQMRAELLAE